MHNFFLIVSLNFASQVFLFFTYMVLMTLIKSFLLILGFYFIVKPIIFKTQYFFTSIIWFYFRFFYLFLVKICFIKLLFYFHFICFKFFLTIQSIVILTFCTIFIAFSIFLSTFLDHFMLFIWNYLNPLITTFLFISLIKYTYH